MHHLLLLWRLLQQSPFHFLKGKQECLSDNGQPVEIKMVAKSSGKPTIKKKSGPSKGGRRPAFSIKAQKGGVFGFK